MMDKASVVRTDATLTEAQRAIAELRSRYASVGIHDHGKPFNTDLIEALELGSLLDCAETPWSARSPARSPVAPIPRRLPERDDANWLKHTMARRTSAV